MRISIRHNSSHIIESDQFVVNGSEAGGGYAMTFSLRGNRQGCELKTVVFDISLSLSLSDPTRPVVTAIPASTQIIQCHNFPNNGEQLLFPTVFTKEQINALEESRRDGDLKLKVELRALTSSGGALLSSYDCKDVIIPREQWLKALTASGFRQTLLLEVPVPQVSIHLSDLISKAQEFIETGHYKDAVMQCRRIVEHVEEERDDKREATMANRKSQNRDEREDMTVIERLLSMREQIKNICQLGAHGNEGFTRSQAKAVLGATLSLLSEPTVGFFDSKVMGLGDGNKGSKKEEASV